MSTYAGGNTYPATATLPDAGQPASAGGIDAPIKDNLDRTTFLLARLAAHAESQSPLEMSCTDGDNIVISPLFGVVTFDTMPRYLQIPTTTTITKAEIEGAVAPVGSATYYLYAYFNASPKFELSLAQPDAYKLFKSTGTSRALVGIIQTDAGAKFMKHRQGRHFVRYIEPPQIRSPIAAAMPATIDLSSRLPPEARGVRVFVNGQTSISVISAFKPYVAISPESADATKFRQLLLPTGLAFGRVNEPVDIPLDAGRKITIQTDSGTSLIEVLLAGFWW